MTEREVALHLGEILDGTPLPAGFKVAIFVIREDAELEEIHVGYVSQAPLKELRRWLRTWLRGTKPKKETVQ